MKPMAYWQYRPVRNYPAVPPLGAIPPSLGRVILDPLPSLRFYPLSYAMSCIIIIIERVKEMLRTSYQRPPRAGF